MKTVWKLLAILTVFLLASLYFLKQAEDISELSKLVDMKVNNTLLQLGISDENIKINLSVEKKSKSARWVEFIKEIKTDKDREDIFKKIKSGLEEYPVRAQFPNDKKSILIYKGDILLNRISFFVPLTRMKAAIIIDDLGPNIEVIDNFMKLGIPLTFSIMPYEKHSISIAQKFALEKQVFFLHQPMQPENFPEVDPGQRALLLKMNEKEIKEMFEKNIAHVVGACGVNNHMGSAFTKDKDKMEQFLQCVKKKNLIFVDSYTSPGSVAYKRAVAMGIPCLRNEFFLDNKDDFKYIISQLEFFKNFVIKNGEGVAIGHVHKKNLPLALEKIIPEFKRAGIEILTIPEYIKTENK